LILVRKNIQQTQKLEPKPMGRSSLVGTVHKCSYDCDITIL